ncbi:MAG TPA: FAD-dependent oxidoreductase [Pyrinomonadaceae bacterium]|nr:FAD-dependent oxidoreductase [Pyrinomonadaceae bacterium]
MDCEVVVVGGGIGGLTVAALLAQRGISVCLFERQPEVGGCAASFEKFGYTFEQTHGLYSSWEADEIHQRIFAELPLEAPEVQPLEPSYIVRLPDQCQVAMGKSAEQFEENLREVFPECPDQATQFYRDLNLAGKTLRKLLQQNSDLLTASKTARTYKLLSRGKAGAKILSAGSDSVATHLTDVSFRFRRFVDAQLEILAQGDSKQVPYLQAAIALNQVHEGTFAIRGGSAALAARLFASIRASGGSIRLNAPVLRLAYDSTGNAIGVDLLSGERVTATRAIVSNLTLWDTYGKLVGLNRTPSEIRKAMQTLRGWGAYLMFLSIEDKCVDALASNRVLALTDWQADSEYDPENQQLFFNAAPAWDPRAPMGKRALTVHAFTAVDSWFSFHSDQEELEAQDQQMLEACWERLHQALPELGDRVEVIDTINPRGYYEATRRKLGMVGAGVPTSTEFWPGGVAYLTSLPNLFHISDTTSGAGLASISRAALLLADKLAPHAK